MKIYAKNNKISSKNNLSNIKIKQKRRRNNEKPKKNYLISSDYYLISRNTATTYIVK